MDGFRFDELAKRLATTGISRRGALRALGGGLAGGVLGMVGRGEGIAATCRPNGGICLKSEQCCSKACDKKSLRCVCQPGQTMCGTACVNATADPNNCGACGHACPTPATATAAVCVNSKCSFVCPGGKRPCGTGCIPADACCNGACDQGQICDQGTCKDDITCPTGTTKCSATSHPTCCGPQTTCFDDGYDDYCCSDVADATNWCGRCPSNEFACCSQNADVNECVCCSDGQTCNTTGRTAVCE